MHSQHIWSTCGLNCIIIMTNVLQLYNIMNLQVQHCLWRTQFNVFSLSAVIISAPNVDYLASSLTVQLSNDQRTLPLSLLIADDGICDSSPRETLQIRLSSSDPNVTLSPGVASVTILDSPPCGEGEGREKQGKQPKFSLLLQWWDYYKMPCLWKTNPHH